MTERESELVRRSLAQPDIHLDWGATYDTGENEEFYEHVFGRILSVLEAPPGSLFLDAGCGSAGNAIWLARRGHKVWAADFSAAVLDMARENVNKASVGERVELHQEDLLGLSFEDESFDYVLCWGVLMHIPEVKRAISELARVLRAGGALVVSETNMRSLDAVLRRLLIGALRKGPGKRGIKGQRSPAGIKYWKETPSGPLMTRHADIEWLISAFAEHGVLLQERLAGQFIESYTVLKWRPLSRLIMELNRLWFRRRWTARIAAENILLLRKLGPATS